METLQSNERTISKTQHVIATHTRTQSKHFYPQNAHNILQQREDNTYTGGTIHLDLNG